jgi:predicted lipoprotein with Yx(FWY)xxD motif
MWTPKLLLAAASALTLTSCATVPPAPVPVVPGASSVTTANKAPFGTYLVDGAGRALYVLEGERMPGGIHRCVGPCLAVWPPLPGALAAGAGVDATMLGTMTMGGTTHATYAGWPLYYYSRDRVPGDTTGQNVTDAWGTWHLLSPSGQPIRPAGGY